MTMMQQRFLQSVFEFSRLTCGSCPSCRSFLHSHRHACLCGPASPTLPSHGTFLSLQPRRVLLSVPKDDNTCSMLVQTALNGNVTTQTYSKNGQREGNRQQHTLYRVFFVAAADLSFPATAGLPSIQALQRAIMAPLRSFLRVLEKRRASKAIRNQSEIDPKRKARANTAVAETSIAASWPRGDPTVVLRCLCASQVVRQRLPECRQHRLATRSISDFPLAWRRRRAR